MAKLFSVLETAYNSNSHPGGQYVAYRSNQVISLQDKTPAGTHSVMIINKLDGSQPDYVEAASAATAIMAAMNAANTTDVHEITLTVIPATGSNLTKRIPVDFIHRVQTDSLVTSRSYLQLEDVQGQIMTQLHITSTPAQVVTLANA